MKQIVSAARQVVRNFTTSSDARYEISKRILDFSLAATAIPTAAAATAVYLADAMVRGEKVSLSTQVVCGKNGKAFKRSTVQRAHSFHRENPLRDAMDFMNVAKYPVLLNVLMGQMSVVGPSINSADSAALNDESVSPARPGLTSSYYVKKRMNIAYESKWKIDERDFANRSLVWDLIVLSKTIPALLLGGPNEQEQHDLAMLGLRLANTTLADAVHRILTLSHERQRQVAFLNPHCFNLSVRNNDYKKALHNADILFPDGIGIQLATKLTGDVLKDNVNGTDLLPLLCKDAQEKGMTIGLLGGKPGVAAKTRENLLAQFPHLRIPFAEHGYFEKDSAEEQQVMERINECAPDVLLVAMGVPTQEIWIGKNIQKLDVGVAIGVGGLFDFYSGTIARAPVWIREIGLEWMWRVAMEPQRMFLRYFIGNPLFLYHIVQEITETKQSSASYRFYRLATPLHRKKEIAKVALRKFLWWNLRTGTLRLKRGTDVVGATTGIMFLMPIFLSTALVIKLEDGGPIFYKHRRVGRHGREFDFYKFRSMVPNASNLKSKLVKQNESSAGVIFKMKKDPRVTNVGRLIRKYSIDELPQLFNVLCGNMSLVGPRPPLPSEVANYKVGDRYRLEVIPGLTCLWQVKGRSDLDFNAQIKLDADYIKSRGFLYDLSLILRTIPVVLSGQGAY